MVQVATMSGSGGTAVAKPHPFSVSFMIGDILKTPGAGNSNNAGNICNTGNNNLGAATTLAKQTSEKENAMAQMKETVTFNNNFVSGIFQSRGELDFVSI